eukprot:m.713426 g.713426  ORF g.713426 m.713426 type:complete len:77 (-) comp22971_c1_seq17:713-943(-)
MNFRWILPPYVLCSTHIVACLPAGDASGTVEACAKFKRWLQTRGSPRAVITKAEFTEERHIGTDTETHVDDAMHVT